MSRSRAWFEELKSFGSGAAPVAQPGPPPSAGVGTKGYVTLIKDHLADKHKDLDIEVIGAGVSGNKVPDLQKRLDGLTDMGPAPAEKQQEKPAVETTPDSEPILMDNVQPAQAGPSVALRADIAPPLIDRLVQMLGSTQAGRGRGRGLTPR